MMEARFESAFVKAMKKHASIKKLVQRKVDLIMENPLGVGEPLKGNWRGFYSCPVKRNFIIIYLFCEVCRKKGDNTTVLCSDCDTTPDGTVKFVLLGPHDQV
jgi:addiction module RelE/StbE family toxin